MSRGPITVTFDTSQFNRALKNFAKDSSRTFSEITNQNSYNVLLAASKMNRKADKTKIQELLGPVARVEGGRKLSIENGKIKRGKKFYLTSYRANDAGAPILALIINKKLGKGHGLKGDAMRAALDKEFARRMSAIGYMRSGWLGAIGNIASKIGKSFKHRKDKLGGSTPARPGANATAHFWNTAFSTEKNTSNPAPDAYAAQALSEAIQQQIGRMAAWAAGRMQREADKRAARFLR